MTCTALYPVNLHLTVSSFPSPRPLYTCNERAFSFHSPNSAPFLSPSSRSMPHTSRKRKVTPYRKRHEETAEDGWTRVTRTDVRAKSNGLTQVTETYTIPQEDHSLNVAKLTTKFTNCLNQWTTTDARRKIHVIIENGLSKNGSGKVESSITTAALMALGSLSRTNVELTTKSMWQLVVFIDVVRSCESPSYNSQNSFFPLGRLSSNPFMMQEEALS